MRAPKLAVADSSGLQWQRFVSMATIKGLLYEGPAKSPGTVLFSCTSCGVTD